MAAVRSTPIHSTRSTDAATNPRATRTFRVVGATALAPDHLHQTEIAPRRAGTTPPRLRLVTTTPRPDAVVRPRPTAAVYRRRRIGVAVAAAALVLVAAQAATALGGHSLASPERRPAAVVTVRPGDSLWTIAERLAPGSDPRPTVDRLQAQLGSTVLQPGQPAQGHQQCRLARAVWPQHRDHFAFLHREVDIEREVAPVHIGPDLQAHQVTRRSWPSQRSRRPTSTNRLTAIINTLNAMASRWSTSSAR